MSYQRRVAIFIGVLAVALVTMGFFFTLRVRTSVDSAHKAQIIPQEIKDTFIP